jgi:IgGFc binding protein
VSGTPDHLVSMLTPVYSWGTTFAIVSFPGGRSPGDVIRVTTSQKSTTVAVYDSGVSRSPASLTVIDRAMDFRQLELSPGALAVVQANKPIQVNVIY